MLRRVLILLVILGLAPGTWLRSPLTRHDPELHLKIRALPVPAGCCRLGPLHLVGAWHLTSRNEFFGGYSALLEEAPGRMLAISDGAYYLRFAAPDALPGPTEQGMIDADWARLKYNHDVESLTADPVSKHQWIAVETSNVILRLGPGISQTGFARPAAMQSWPHNLGAESMVRLTDGRFVVLGESYTGWFAREDHPALLFAGDPTGPVTPQPFTFRGPGGYRPTDMVQLPDGQVLITMRKVVWPFPIRFSIRLILADPARIKPGETWQGQDLGEIAAPSLVDNYEGLAVSIRPGKPVRIWMISDNNASAFERVLLLAWDLDPASLPPPADKQKGAQGSPHTPLH